MTVLQSSSLPVLANQHRIFFVVWPSFCLAKPAVKQAYDEDGIRGIQFALRVQNIALCLFNSKSCQSQMMEL
jgi:hypothetical protein